MYLAILGRQPKIGLAELESVLGAECVSPLGSNAALLDTNGIAYRNFGSVIKFAKVIKKQASASPQRLQKSLINLVLEQSPPVSGAKLKIGFSFYGDYKPSIGQINSMALSIKKSLKNKGYSLRIVPNKATALGSAQVLHNRLTGPSGIEIVIINQGAKVYLAKTVHEQDIEAYTARDQARPKRDARVGMLPPKLAQTIINLATGKINENDDLRIMNYEQGADPQGLGLDAVQGISEAQAVNNEERILNYEDPGWGQSSGLSLVHGNGESRSEMYRDVHRASNAAVDKVISQEKQQVASSARKQAASARVLLDPFCGTGVILQEAMLMGLDVYGTDLEPRMIEYSKTNLDWLRKKHNLSNKVTLKSGDATSYSWKPIPKIVATETYLGRPFSALPKPELLSQIIQDVNMLHKKALINIYNQLPKGSRVCLAVPAWQVAPGKFKSLPILDQLDKIGYNQLEFKNINAKDLIYAREDQVVGRQLVVLTN